MARINIFGDFKANKVKHLNLSAELVYLLNTSDINMVNLEAPVISNGKPIKKVARIFAKTKILRNGLN